MKKITLIEGDSKYIGKEEWPIIPRKGEGLHYNNHYYKVSDVAHVIDDNDPQIVIYLQNI